MADVTARWPVAVGVSVAVHAAVALALLGLLGRAVAPESKPALQKPTAVEVFRVGSLLPRAGRATSAPPATDVKSALQRSRTAPTSITKPAGEVPAPLLSPVGEAASPARAEAPGSLGEAAGSDDSALHTTKPGAEAQGSLGGAAASGDSAEGRDLKGAAESGVPSAADERGAAGGPATVDPSIAAEVHARLARAASDCYPAQARRFRQQGHVPVSFCVEGAGNASKVVVTSSGAALLDEAARGCVMQRAEPFPAAAAGSCFAVKVEFGSTGVHVSR